MRPRNGNQSQFKVMIEFMERHGNVDLCLRDETVQVRSQNCKKWQELTDILNSKFKNDAKSLEKWRKAWCDFKYNTAKKYVKLRQKGGALTDVEERVLQILAGKNKIKYCTKHMIDIMEGQKIKNVLEPDSSAGHSLTASTLPDIFCDVTEMTAAPRPRNNSTSSQASCSSSKHPSTKEKENVDDMNDVADQFLEFERERGTAITRSKKCIQGQYKIMVEFMERHGGDLLCGGDTTTVQIQRKNCEKWEELTDILNSKFKNNTKSQEKWRKAWTDFKNNTKRKYKRLRHKGGALTDVEERVLRMLAGKNKKNNSTKHMIDMEGQKVKNALETDSCEGDSSHSLTASTFPDIFCDVTDMTAAPRTRKNSFSSQASCSSSKHPSKKRKENADDMDDIDDRFLEFEREKDTAVMGTKSDTQGQFMVMIEFMERHGDLGGLDQTAQCRINKFKRWEELTGILNSKFENDAKSLDKWRKAWADFKSNTKKKYEKLRQEGGALKLTDVEERFLRMMAGENENKNSTKHMIDVGGQKIKIESELDSCEGDSSHSLTASTLPDIFCDVTEMTAAPRTRNISSSSQASCSSSKHSPKKRKENDMNDTPDRFLELRRKRETEIMGIKTETQRQCMVMMEFMKQHGDLCNRDQTVQVKRKNSRKWEELADILNNKFKKDAKSLEKWRKVWNDFKNNAKKKYERLRQRGGALTLTDAEERVLQMMARKYKKKNSTKHMTDMEGQKIKNVLETDACEGDSSHSLTSTLDLFGDVTEITAAPRTRNNSSLQASCNSSKHPSKNGKENPDDMDDIADHFLEFERDTEIAIMRVKSDTQGQCMVIMDFMERHGDLCNRDQTAQVKRKNSQKWEELTDILNSKFKNDAKSEEKWRKTWSDFRNNTRKKYEKLKQRGGALILTDAEERVLRMMEEKNNTQNSTKHMIDMEDQTIKIELEQESCEGDSSNSVTSILPDIFCDVTEMTAAPRTRNNSSSSQTSCSSTHSPKERKENANDMNDFTDRFLEFERKREKMAHEREMARIKQHDQLLSVFNRMVNVLETLAPSIQKFLDHSNSQDG